MTEQNDKANDYALAKYLNERVVAIFALVADHQGQDLPNLSGINRSYVLMVDELKKLYSRNTELSNIRENICWRTFETIDAIDPYILFEYSDDYRNHGNEHISKVNSLCIIAAKETPELTPELSQTLSNAKKNVAAFIDNWLIPEYTFDITEEGILLVNNVDGVMNVRKVQAGSAVEMILTQAKLRPNVLFKPDLKGHSLVRGLRTSLSEVGFEGALQQLFWPVMDNIRGVKFRPRISRRDADSENIDLTALDKKLKELGIVMIADDYNLRF